MKAKRIWFMALFMTPALAAGYMAWLMWRANDDGKWLFIVFASFFLALGISPFLPKSRRQKEEEKVPTTRFAGAWVLPFWLMILVGALVLAVLGQIVKSMGK